MATALGHRSRGVNLYEEALLPVRTCWGPFPSFLCSLPSLCLECPSRLLLSG